MTAKKIIYFGFNNFKKHKRGVENVILSQAASFANPDGRIIYVYTDEKLHVHKYRNIICIELPNTVTRFIYLNILLFKLKKKYFKGEDTFFIHSHNYLLSFFSFFNTTVFTVHDGLFYAKSCQGSRLGAFWKIIEKVAYRRSKKIHFISKFSLQQSLVKRKDDSKNIIIYNTTPLEKDYTNNTIQGTLNRPFEILIVRSIERRANLDLIIEVALKAKMAETKLKIIIIGKGPLLDDYRKTITSHQLENVEMLGYLPDEELKCYYNNCDLVIVPCIYGEGFGLPVIEGYLFNKPVLASNVCALPEIIISDSDLFDNDSSEVLFKIFEKLKDTEDKRYREYYNENFSGAVIQGKYKALLYSY